ncbi:MAG: ABC transporter ATP-binding protein [Bacillota bacterium]
MLAMMVELINVCKKYGQTVAAHNLFLQVAEGEFFTFLGPSGCGKTTTLRLIAGFIKPDSGSIKIDGQVVTGLPPYLRDVNTVFQSYALFPHLTIQQNIAFGLEMRRLPSHDIKVRVNQAIEMMGLEGLEQRKPGELSGGQQQRVAVARALVCRPRVLLLDEPLGALDVKLKRQIQIELKGLQRRLGTTFIYVTHDQEEALSMSDRIGVMNDGVLVQVATPMEIYDMPMNSFVADFVGETNLFPATVLGQQGNLIELTFLGKRFSGISQRVFQMGQPIYVSVRPEHIRLNNTSPDRESLLGRVQDIIFSGSQVKMVISVGDFKAVAIAKPEEALPQGAEVFLFWETRHGIVLAREGSGSQCL